jgi:class 3 adenylate cyclase
MTLHADLETEVATIFRQVWTTLDGKVVPDPEDLKLAANYGVRLEAAILYADLAASTALVDGHGDEFAAEVYKAFLTCSARIIKASGGVITAYDGDRIMAVFLGDYKNTEAALAGLKINHAMEKIIKPKLAAQYPTFSYVPSHAVGVDRSTILAARVGVRNDNDIVWVGRAANHAAKLCDIRKDNYRTWITKTVYDEMVDRGRVYNGTNMWVRHNWTQMGNAEIYASNWTWGV